MSEPGAVLNLLDVKSLSDAASSLGLQVCGPRPLCAVSDSDPERVRLVGQRTSGAAASEGESECPGLESEPLWQHNTLC